MFWIFTSLLIVQGLLLVPNLWTYEQDLLEILGSAEKDKLNMVLEQLDSKQDISSLKSKGSLLGATLADVDTGRIYLFGKIPSTPPDVRYIGRSHGRSGQQTDVVWSIDNSLGRFIVAGHLDASGVRADLKIYALKLLLISLFVGLLVSMVALWVSVKYFIQPLDGVVGLLRKSRLEGHQGIKDSTGVQNFDEFSGLVEEYNCMINDQREAARQVKVKQQFLEYAAHHDPLTHLPNRLMFDEKLKSVVVESLENDHAFAIYLLDVDNFKFFNDQYGHDVGDKMVKEIGGRLLSMMRDVDTVARLDGDEFVVLQKEVTDREATEGVARRLLKVIAQSFEYRGFTLKTTASIGVAFFPDDVHLGEDNTQLSEEIVNNASVALQEAKLNGRGGFQIFNEAMRKRITERMTLEEDLKTGLSENQFEVYYQPKVNMQTGEVIGSEALVRWHHPTLGNIRPDIFIPVAEESGIIIPLGEWILRTACRDSLKLQQMGLGDLQVAVNISAVQFTGGDLLPMVKRALDETKFSSSLLELEITESAVMHDPEQVIQSLHELSRFGIKLAIDDFGTGYSSLAYLKRFPVDTLKIDRAFIKDISRDSDDVVIVEAVLGLGKHFGLKVVAEGVEDDEQYEFLRRQGCDIAQGYHLSPPLAFDQYVAWLEEWNKEQVEINESTAADESSVVPLRKDAKKA
ncbi:MAG: EAL domain-containing protein [Gammaproteobacteria bacterium]|nr:EAL domain-containing protein [Gammaproteobacteria bacterium]